MTYNWNSRLIRKCILKYSKSQRSVFRVHPDKSIVGVDWGEGPPVPIPNTEVKLISAENTCRVTDREDR